MVRGEERHDWEPAYLIYKKVEPLGVRVIGVAGGSCSGKTTLAKHLADYFGATILHMDNYYFDLDKIPDRNLDKPEAVNFRLLMDNLEGLLAGRPVEAPVHDFRNFCTKGHELIQPTEVIIVEGLFALLDPLYSKIDVPVFVEAPPEVRFARRLARDLRERGRTKEYVESYWPLVREMHDKYVEPQKEKARFLVNNF